MKRIHIVCINFFLYYILHFLVLHKPLFFVSSYYFWIPVSEKCDSPGMSYVGSSARFMFMNPLFSNIENGLISFAIKAPIYLVISPFLSMIWGIYFSDQELLVNEVPHLICVCFSHNYRLQLLFSITWSHVFAGYEQSLYVDVIHLPVIYTLSAFYKCYKQLFFYPLFHLF